MVQEGGVLRGTVSGQLTVQTGGRLDATGAGYPGATTSNSAGGVPAGVAGSGPDAGASHGAQGESWPQPQSESSGAGGSIVLHVAGAVAGSGQIDASGGQLAIPQAFDSDALRSLLGVLEVAGC